MGSNNSSRGSIEVQIIPVHDGKSVKNIESNGKVLIHTVCNFDKAFIINKCGLYEILSSVEKTEHYIECFEVDKPITELTVIRPETYKKDKNGWKSLALNSCVIVTDGMEYHSKNLNK